MKKIFLAIALLVVFQQINAQTEQVTINKAGSVNGIKNTYNPMGEGTVHLPVVSVNDEDTDAPSMLMNTTKSDKSALSCKRILKPGESVILKVENGTVTDDSTHITLSSNIENAIARVPKWLQNDLRFKLRQLNSSYRQQMITLLNGTPKKYLDEVAYQCTYLATEVLTNNGFNLATDWASFKSNAELIYKSADSLKYVRLKEYGDTNTGDWYTTTEYRIKQGSNYIWREADRYYYYMFIVMPKIYDEALLLRDFSNSTYRENRTWGYTWRNYLWYNPDPSHNYQRVNRTGNPAINSSGTRQTVTIDTVQRLGKLMQMPEYLWDERATMYFFNRNFSSSQGALDVLGNWASRLVPQDVTSASDTRPSQANQIAHKHVGNCHEDAITVVASARTSLIPCMHVSDLCDDHVWAAINDGGDDVWHHFEFFRGGLSANRPYYWGMTNMQKNGGYGWVSSYVYGKVPDGTLINLSKTYSEDTACSMTLKVRDKDNNPVDGARISIYSVCTQYSTTNPDTNLCGYVWTDADGEAHLDLGSGKKYLARAYHQKLGYYPTSGLTSLLIANGSAVPGRAYNKTLKYTRTASSKRDSINAAQNEYDASKSLEISVRASNITSDVKPTDAQGGTFYDRTGTPSKVSVYAVDANEIDKFRTRSNGSANAEYFFGQIHEGSAKIPVHSSGVTYIVLANNTNYNNCVELEYGADIVNGASFDNVIGLNDVETPEFRIYPNPTSGLINFSVNGGASSDLDVELYDLSGSLIKVHKLNGGSMDVSDLKAGIYVVKCAGMVQKIVKK